MPRILYAGGTPLLNVRERPAGPTSGNGLTLSASAGSSTMSAREVEDLRDTLTHLAPGERPMTQLSDTLDRFTAIKHEHLRDEQRTPGPRPSTIDDVDTLRRLIPAGVDAEELWVLALAHVDQVLRDLARAGQLRGANRKTLRAALFSAWLDGAGLGMHHGRP